MLLQWTDADGPLHRRLSLALRKLIDLGELPGGATLPPERALSDVLAVSRTTVVSAYRTLVEGGRLERQQGSGTRVVLSPDGRRTREVVSARNLIGDHTADVFLTESASTIDFVSAVLPQLPLVAEVASAVTLDEYRALTSLRHGYHPGGLPELRKRIAELYSAAGAPTEPDQILITSGAQQALELIVRGCLRPQDHVVVEDPTYRGALEAFALADCHITPVSSDERGADPTGFSRIAQSSDVRLVYVQSCVQNPTGATPSIERGRQILRIAERYGTIVVEDTALSGTEFDGLEHPPLAAIDTSAEVITIGSMSKLFWAGLRIGWIRASRRTIARFGQIKGLTDLGTSLISQQISIRLLEHRDEVCSQRRTQLLSGLDELTTLLSENLGQWSWTAPRGGASLWVTLPTVDATYFSQVALRYGVAILPGSVFSPSSGRDCTRLPYGVDVATMRAGVRRLARAWEAYSSLQPEQVPFAPIRT